MADSQIRAFITPNGHFLRLLNSNFKSTDEYKFQNIKRKEFNWGVDKIREYNIPIVRGSLKNWSGALGEYYVFSNLTSKGKHVRRPKINNGLIPDWECDDFIYEVKTRNYSSEGSVGDKALGVPLKYIDLPDLYKKELKIVLVARMEIDGVYKYDIMNDKDSITSLKSDTKQQILDTYERYGISFIGASQL